MTWSFILMYLVGEYLAQGDGAIQKVTETVSKDL